MEIVAGEVTSDQQIVEYFAFKIKQKQKKMFCTNIQKLVYLSKALAVSRNQTYFQQGDFCKSSSGHFSRRIQDLCESYISESNLDTQTNASLNLDKVYAKPKISSFVAIFLETIFNLYGSYNPKEFSELLYTPVWKKKSTGDSYTIEDLKEDAEYLQLFDQFVKSDVEESDEEESEDSDEQKLKEYGGKFSNTSERPQEFFKVSCECKILDDGSILYY